MRCPSCNKFPSFDEPEVEENEAEVRGDTVTLDTTILLRSQCCGEDCKSAEFNEWEVESTEVEATDRYEDKDRNGKPITNSRYMKHMYGVTAHVTLKCQREGCDAPHEMEMSDEVQASGMEELA